METLNLTRNSDTHFAPIILDNGWTLSIQASSFHYSYPKESLPSSDDYSKFELAIFYNDDWVNPSVDNRLKDYLWSDNWTDSDDVAGYVDREDVVKILNDLKNLKS